ncbi:MAG TPA: hypothetical protein VFP84_35445 [Kofleriaceae bacterium]|nr:hypothetical protein [Kofleriaceae bacterium]
MHGDPRPCEEPLLSYAPRARIKGSVAIYGDAIVVVAEQVDAYRIACSPRRFWFVRAVGIGILKHRVRVVQVFSGLLHDVLANQIANRGRAIRMPVGSGQPLLECPIVELHQLIILELHQQ